MSSKKFKRPSSARRHIRLETFTPFVSGSRLASVQNLLRDGDTNPQQPDAILCITGIDSRYNDGTNELIHYLLFGFFEVRKQELERSGYEEETIDDLIILIRHNEVDIYCNPINYHYLLPYVSHWRNVRFHCMTDDEYEDEEAAENFKVTSFVAMVEGLQKIGIPYCHSGLEIGEFDKMLLEKWPIIQAYALEDYGGGGFFTLKYETVDMGRQLQELYSLMDPVAMEMMLTNELTLFERQWSTAVTMIDVEMASTPQRLMEEKISEPLKSFYRHGRIGTSLEDKNEQRQGPFVLFGSNTKKTMLTQLKNGDKVSQSDLHNTGINGHAKHMICHGVSPKGPLCCTRTYFFTDMTDSHSGEMLMQVYAAMVDSVLEAVNVYSSTLSLHKARAAAVDMLCDQCSLLSNPTLTKYIQRKTLPVEEGSRSLMLKSASLYLYDIPSCLHSAKVLGSLAFSEMFQDSVIEVSREDGTQRYDSSVLFVTSSVPRFKAWAVRKTSQEAPVAKTEMQSLTGYGKQLMSGEIVHFSTERHIYSPALEADLYVFEQAIVIWTQQLGKVILDKSNIKGLRFYDANSFRVISVLMVDIKLSAKTSLPTFLQSREATVYVTFIPKSKAFKLMYQEVLPAWKDSDTELPTVEKSQELPKAFIPQYTQQQNKLTAEGLPVSPYHKAKGLFSNLDQFMSHFAVSSVSSSQVEESVLPTLLNKVTEVIPSPETSGVIEVNTKQFSGIVVTILSGIPGSHKDNLCNTLLRVSKHISWTVLKQPLNASRCIVPREFQRTLTSLWTSYRRKRVSDPSTPKPKVLLVTPGFLSAMEVAIAIVNHPDPDVRKHTRIGAVTVCIDPLNSFIHHKLNFPHLLNQCAQGWVNNILFTSSTSIQDSNLAEIQGVLRSVNSDVAFFLAEKGEIVRSGDIDAVLSENLFIESSKVRARNLLTPGWTEGVYSLKRPGFSMNSVVLNFTQPLERTPFINRLRGLRNEERQFPFCGSIFFVEGQVYFSDSEQQMDVQYCTTSNFLSVTKSLDQSGLVANGDGINHSQSTIMFTGFELKEEILKDWIRSCAKQKPKKKDPLTRKDLTKDAIKKIHADHHLDDLPAGWFYNGTQYVSFDGEKQDQHPSLDEFIEGYIKQKNQEIEEFNKEAELSARQFVDLFS
ncbi:hypothetical protein FSP39_014571 [Pinctada imbricata]|uniref:Uncharacterized protein n=1 Tax=Pinctada imbricata TaxID=66713 RepID=A0AA88Y0K9_PINIB|nr:hypothetical protein FSP39_014571 [Pinctada imbricata]